MYGVNVGAGAGPAGAGSFAASAEGDLDFDGTNSDFGYIHPGTAGALAGVGPAFGPCPTSGTYDAGTLVNDLLNTVGPCNLQSGQSQF